MTALTDDQPAPLRNWETLMDEALVQLVRKFEELQRKYELAAEDLARFARKSRELREYIRQTRAPSRFPGELQRTVPAGPRPRH